jgi:hypothetical protein
VAIDQTRHEGASVAVDHDRAVAGTDVRPDARDQIVFDEHVLTHGQGVVGAVEDVDVGNEYLYRRFVLGICRARERQHHDTYDCEYQPPRDHSEIHLLLLPFLRIR